MANDRPYRTDSPFGLTTVLSTVAGCILLAMTMTWAVMVVQGPPANPPRPAAPPVQAPMPQLPKEVVKIAPPPELTDDERFDADARDFRNRSSLPEWRLPALRRLLARGARRDEVLALILGEYRAFSDGYFDTFQESLARVLAECGRDGMQAFFRGFPDKEYQPNLPSTDKAFWSGVHTLVRHSPDDLALIDVMLARPDRRALFGAYTGWKSAALDDNGRAALKKGAEDRDPSIRLLAVEMPQIGVDVLRDRLADDDATVRAHALYRLVTSVTTDRWQADAVNALGDPAPGVRLTAGWAVGLRAKDQAAAAPVLLEIAQQLTLPNVKAHAGTAFGVALSYVVTVAHAERRRLGLQALVTLLTLEPEHRAGAREVLAALARQPSGLRNYTYLFATFPGECPGLLAVVLRDLDGAHDHYRQLLARRLADHFPDEGVKEAEARLAHAEPRVRWLALDLLMRSDPDRAGKVVPELVPLFRPRGKPSGPVVRREWREGPTVEAGPEPLPALDWTQAKDVKLTEASLEWLAIAFRAGDTGALPLLTALGPKLEPALPALVGCGTGAFAGEPYRAMLRAAGVKAAPAVIAAMSKPKGTEHEYALLPVLVALGAEVPDARTALGAWVTARRSDSQLADVVSKSSLGVDPTFAPVWVAALRGNRQRQTWAREALATHGPDAAPLVPALVELLKTVGAEKEPPFEADEAVIDVLGRIGPKAKAAVPVLIGLFPKRGEPAALACSRIGSAAVPELVKALRHAEPRVRGYAAEALGKIGPAAKELALPELLRLEKAEQGGGVREQARRALRVLEPEMR